MIKKKGTKATHSQRVTAHPVKAQRVQHAHAETHSGTEGKTSHPHSKPHAAAHAHSRAVAVRHHHKKTEKPVHHHIWIWVLSSVAVLGVAFLFFHNHAAQLAKKNQHKAPPAIPVSTAVAREGNIGVYLEALGTVTPLSMVTITSRVQGEITSVKYTEGQMVHKGDPLIEIDSRPYEAALKQAQGQLARDQAELNRARSDLSRYRKAAAENAIPKQQLEDQIQTVNQDMGTVRIDEGAVENAQVNLAYCHIQSPLDGRVGLRLVDSGNMVQATGSSPLAVVAQLQPITVVFSVPEDNLAAIQEQIQNGQSMSVDIYDRSKEKKLATGKFLTIDNQVDPATGTVKVKAQFDNEDNSLFPNQFVNARLLVTTQQNATLLSSSAIQRNTKGAFVYVVKSDHSTEMRQIKTGITEGDTTAVTGIKVGEMIATNGFDKLQEGAKVTPTAARKQE